jgi:hypothetical protein
LEVSGQIHTPAFFFILLFGDVAEDTTQLQNTVLSFLSEMEPEETAAFASLVYFYEGRHDVRYNGRILCTGVTQPYDV